MRILKSRSSRVLYFFYRIIEPVFDPIKFIRGIIGYFWFIADVLKYIWSSKSLSLVSSNIFPQLHDKTQITPFDSHYYYQQLWAFEKIIGHRPARHVDIASTYQLSGYLSKLIPTTFIDIRPFNPKLKKLTVKDNSILDLPYRNSSVESISCLHVVEHIGLGRYGDPIDPDGMMKACLELSRILKPKGVLYFSTPIGKNRLCFNAHRVTDPKVILEYFKSLKLVSFSCVTDSNEFIENANYLDFCNAGYACGMFVFTKQ